MYVAGFAWSNSTHIIFWFLVLSEANSKNMAEDGKWFHLGFNLKIKIFTVFVSLTYQICGRGKSYMENTKLRKLLDLNYA